MGDEIEGKNQIWLSTITILQYQDSTQNIKS